MTLFSYEIFDAVARQGSFNKAAQQLHLTPSAISHAIAVMEAELGFTLFNRGKNGVTMTSYGASLYPSIRAVLNSDEALKQSIARLNGLEKGKVKLGAFNSVCAGLLPQILKSFMASFPQIEVEVYQGTYDDVKEWLRTGQVDLAFLSATCREEFNLTELFREPLLCIVPQDWPEPPNGIMTPELMNGQSFVVQCDATDAEMRQFLKKYSISTERRCHVIDDQSNIAMVEAGLGISIMPRMLRGGSGGPAPHGDGPGGRTDVPSHRGLLPPDGRTASSRIVRERAAALRSVFFMQNCRIDDCIRRQNTVYYSKPQIKWSLS